MNKKILAKTLLPIATVALLGGGIASSLVLTSSSKDLTISTQAEAAKYLLKHARVFPRSVFYYDENNELINADSFYDFAYPYYDKQAFINGYISSVMYDGSADFFAYGGKIILNKDTLTFLIGGSGTKFHISKFNHLDDYVIEQYEKGFGRNFSLIGTYSLSPTQDFTPTAFYHHYYNQAPYVIRMQYDLYAEFYFYFSTLDLANVEFLPQQ
jgi:hypothetical protein